MARCPRPGDNLDPRTPVTNNYNRNELNSSPDLSKLMPVKTPSRRALKPKQRVRLPIVDPNANAVPFKVTAFAAAVFEKPAISDAVEDEPVFDKSKAKRVVKAKKA